MRGKTDRAASLRYGQSASSSPDRNADRGGARIPAPEAGDFANMQQPKGSKGPGSRILLRNWRISTRLVSLLALPVVAATTLGAFRIEDSWQNLQQLENMKLLTDMTEEATELADMLQQERDKSAGLIVDGNPKHPDITDARDETDKALIAFTRSADEIDTTDDEDLAGVNNSLTSVIEKLNKINSIRKTAYSDDTGGAAQTVKAYGELVDSLVSLSQDMALATSNPEMIAKTRALATFSSAKEYASVQQAIISAALAEEPRNDFAEADRLEAASAQEAESSSLKLFAHLYSGRIGLTDLMRSLDGGNASVQQADTFAKNLVNNPDSIKNADMSYRHWYELDSVKIEEMKKIEQHLLQEMEQTARDLRSEAQQEAILNGVLILLVLLISLAGAFVVARSMVRSLRRLQDTAQTVAQKRLPELVKQLSDADPQDVDTSVETVGINSRDEIGKVASAFDDVHREAVRLAAEQALLRGNVNAMFTNLSRRSQGLIQRQLSLISELESREADPDQLENLFKLDHLATRMRRNGENLLVLAGEEPGRRWTRPVPLVDVLRAAASEVEQYERIELSAVPATQVAGRVVNDLVHLLAELLENATSFSSPQTKVKVTGHALPDGRVLVEIHDTGIGLSPEDLGAINERLANPPTVDVSVSRRMGLFVVGRLSLRHGIRIQLRPSDSGGTTALVMLPVDVTQNGGAAGGKQPAGAAAGAPGAGAGGPGKGAPARGGAPGRGGAMSRLGAAQQRGQVGAGAGSGRPALPSRDAGGSGGPGGPGQRPGLPGREPAGAGSAFGRSPGSGSGTGSAFPGGSAFGAAPGANSSSGAGLGAPPARPGLPARPGADSGVREPADAQHTGAGLRDSGRDRHDGPREHADADTTQFSRPDVDGPPPGGGGGIPAFGSVPPPRSPQSPVPGQAASYGAPQDTGEHPMPPPQRRPRPGPQDTGEHPVARPGPHDTGAHPVPPAVPGAYDTGEHPVARPGPGDTGEYAMPGQRPGPGDTGEYAMPGQRPGPHDTGEYPTAVPRQPAESPLADSLLDGGPLPARGDESTPIFESMESNWFRGDRGRGQTPVAPTAPTAAQPPADAPPAAQQQDQDAAAGPAAAAPASQPATATPAPAWRPSPNDDRWRRAEQLRTPQAGGVTTSGLPRRVPRANLVAGTAQQSANASGTQVSRAPDDVRGRLTSLRRGIQRGRQAGGTGETLGGNGFGPTYQQER
ncbi:nitrate- and nitrite sensing domain-containing protein [Streptomyces sp. WMMC500]|uniref:sensor histidine kinase n=1 Tax=Streptomyces sp. WMMC500 TaxID=3015154 RepID=UPI00248BF47C|nr:nitrate- and nitrite sensing domain-containing protein [Streptomyces sp. WMMC500]WBB62833.1 nitrate- and nitrite sensing domain-containing protein [Streptomyces sp. WMMC500]